MESIRHIDVNLSFKVSPIGRNLEGLNQETVVAMEREQNVKLNDQERQLLVLPWFLSLCVVSPHLVGNTNSACTNLPVVAINILYHLSVVVSFHCHGVCTTTVRVGYMVCTVYHYSACGVHGVYSVPLQCVS